MKKYKLKIKYEEIKKSRLAAWEQSSIWKRKYDEMLLLNSKQDTEINIIQVDNDNLRDALKERDEKIKSLSNTVKLCNFL